MVTATTRIRLEKQAYASNDEAWGDHLNEGVFDLVDEAVAGYVTVALVGNYTLDSQNYITDEARNATIKFTGTGSFTVTAPAVEKQYVIWNACTGDLTLKPSGGTGSIIRAGKKAVWITDGSTGYTLDPTLDEIKTAAADVAMGGFKLTGAGKATSTNDVATLANTVAEFAAPAAALSMNSQKITSLATPTVSTDAASKGYVDGFAFNAALPGGSAAGQVAIYNGTAPVWGAVDLADSDARTGILPVANGGTGLATLTAASVLVGNGTSAPALVAPGAAGTALISNGAGVNPSFQTFSSAGLVFLSSQTAANVTSLDFTTGINSTYDVYEFHIINIKPASNALLYLRTSTNGGSSYDSAASDYIYANSGTTSASGTLNAAQSTGAAQMQLSHDSAISSEPGYSGIVRMYKPSSAQKVHFTWQFVYFNVAPNVSQSIGGGVRNASADVDAIRFYFNSVNTTSGTIAMYGVRRS